jgi:hypothetical protein
VRRVLDAAGAACVGGVPRQVGRVGTCHNGWWTRAGGKSMQTQVVAGLSGVMGRFVRIGNERRSSSYRC